MLIYIVSILTILIGYFAILFGFSISSLEFIPSILLMVFGVVIILEGILIAYCDNLILSLYHQHYNQNSQINETYEIV